MEDGINDEQLDVLRGESFVKMLANKLHVVVLRS